MTITTTNLWTKKDQIDQARFVDETFDPGSLAPGQALLKVDTFAFSANNITYALLGESFRYWSFFPTPEPDWGRVPVWGFAEVSHSTHPEINVGERVYGYFPLGSHLLVEPVKVTARAFVDNTEHRRDLPAVYNQYIRVEQDETYDKATEGLMALLRPLFVTSFLLDDYLRDNDLFGGSTVVVTSASSKTAFAAAHLLQANRPDGEGYEVIGLTSAGNVAFVEGLGCYDRVLPYEEIETLDTSKKVLLIDIAGNADLSSRVHHHYGNNLIYSGRIGIAHAGAGGLRQKGLPGAEPSLFFAPDHADKRLAEWGGSGFQMRYGKAWASFVEQADQWLTQHEHSGLESVEPVYQRFVAGGIPPDEGHVFRV